MDRSCSMHVEWQLLLCSLCGTHCVTQVAHIQKCMIDHEAGTHRSVCNMILYERSQ